MILEEDTRSKHTASRDGLSKTSRSSDALARQKELIRLEREKQLRHLAKQLGYKIVKK